MRQSNLIRNTAQNTAQHLTPNLTAMRRSSIGFDHLAGLLHKTEQQQNQPSYPPYNIESLSEDKYRITMAVAGFVAEELDIESQQNNLIIKGAKAANDSQTEQSDAPQRQFIHQGIKQRDFERKFQLGDFVKVVDASVDNGLLTIDLAKEIPEALKSRKIAIQRGA